MASSRVICGLDIGTTKIAAAVAENDPSRGLILRGINVVPTEAISRGIVRDLNQAAEHIDQAFSGAVYSSGLSTDSAFVGITGRDLTGINCHGEYISEHPGGEVSIEDVQKLYERAQPERLAPQTQVVHTLVRQFYLDGVKINRDPAGMIGRKLEVDSYVLLGPESQIANLERAIGRVQLKVRSYVYTLVAAAECVLTPEEKGAGCVLIDFGGGTTDVGVFLNGSLTYSRSIPIGGQNYDHDLKQGLQVSFDEAQRIKKSYGKAWTDPDPEELETFIDVKYYGRREFDKVKRRRVYEIMQPRTEELFERLYEALHESDQYQRAAGGIVIVGGGSQLRNLRGVLKTVFGREVRMGVPLPRIAHVLDEYKTPAMASTLGLLLYGATYRDPLAEEEQSFLGELGSAIGDVVKDVWRRLRGENGKPDDEDDL
jgi:cell division protein FtsA